MYRCACSKKRKRGWGGGGIGELYPVQPEVPQQTQNIYALIRFFP